MIAVGIDVSKYKSTIAVLNSDGVVLASPFDMKHNIPEMDAFVKYLKGFSEQLVIPYTKTIWYKHFY